MKQQNVDYCFCMFCFKEAGNLVVFKDFRRQLPVCDECLKDVKEHRKTLADVKDRVKELNEIGVLT